MISPRYFKEKICDELEDASLYLKKAIDCIESDPDWVPKFRYLAEAEQEHATILYKMFMDMYVTETNRDRSLESMRDAIMDCFSTHMRKIEDCKATLDMMLHDEEENPPETVTLYNNEETHAVSNIMKGISE